MEEKKFTWKEIDEDVEDIVNEMLKFFSDLKTSEFQKTKSKVGLSGH